ncbi:MAG: MATE family efflux transporter [Fusobacteriaceae bacterium]
MKQVLSLEQESVVKLLIKYSIPAIIGMLVSALYNVVDRIFIGNMKDIGELAITGLGVTMPITTLILAFGMLIGVGATANISIKLGQKNRESAEKIIGNIVTLSFLIGIIITVIGFLFKDKILVAFGASDSTIIYAEKYIEIILLGTVFNILGYGLNTTIRADGSPKISSMIMVLSCFLNIILDPIFIFKFNMGIKGAAYATILSQIITALLSVMYYRSSYSNLKIKKINLLLDKKIIKLIFIIGVSPFVMQVSASLVQVINNNALKTNGGDLAIGAMATVNAVALLCFMPVLGISQGAQPIIGYNYGAKKYDRVEKAYKLSSYIGVALFTIALIFAEIFTESIVGLFNKNVEMMSISVRGMRIYISAMPLIGLGMAGSNYFLAIGKGKEAMFLSLLRQVILLVPLIIILSNIYGLDGVWVSQPICDIIAAIITVLSVNKSLKKYRN